MRKNAFGFITFIFQLILILSSTAYAQGDQPEHLFNRIWQFEEVVVNAPGAENVYLTILPINGQSQSVNLIFARDGNSYQDYQTYIIPSSGAPGGGRRFVLYLNNLPNFVGMGLQISSIRVSCGLGCSAALVIRPSGEKYWSGATYVKGTPIVEEVQPLVP